MFVSIGQNNFSIVIQIMICIVKLFEHIIFCKLCRKITPSEENIAVKCLSKDIQMRNLRKLKVNADVTFVIWILEWVGYVFIMTSFIFVALLKINILLDVAIVVYYVMLPHSYLMNTSHNKDRIIDEGLKNIIKNVLHIPFDLSAFVNLFRSANRENRDARTDDIITNKVEAGERKPEISIVVRKNIHIKNIKVDVDPRLKNSIEIPEAKLHIDKPCSSSGIYDEDGQNHLAITTMTDSEDDMIDEIADNDLRLSMKKQLLTYMKGSVNDEEHYIHYFLQLIDLESKMRNKNNLDGDNVIITVVLDEKTKERKRLSCKTKNSKNTNSKSKKLQNGSDAYPFLSPRGLTISADKQFDRTLMRIKKLESIDRHCDNEEAFKKFLNELIDFEEGLTKNEK